MVLALICFCLMKSYVTTKLFNSERYPLLIMSCSAELSGILLFCCCSLPLSLHISFVDHASAFCFRIDCPLMLHAFLQFKISMISLFLAPVSFIYFFASLKSTSISCYLFMSARAIFPFNNLISHD